MIWEMIAASGALLVAALLLWWEERRALERERERRRQEKARQARLAREQQRHLAIQIKQAAERAKSWRGERGV